MSQLTPAMETALAGDRPLVFCAVRIDHPDATIRLLDGSCALELFTGETFAGRDSTYGTLGAIDDIDDSMGNEAPQLSFTMIPPTDEAMHALTDQAAQGARVRLWLGALDRATGAVVADPLQLADVEIDQAVPTIGKGKREVDFECVSSMDRFFDNDEGFRLSDANHQRIWPGELGLSNISGTVKKIYWGVARPTGAASSGGGGGFAAAVRSRIS